MIGFLTRTRGRTGPDLTDWLAWMWLVCGTLCIVIPIFWAGLSSFKAPAEINTFPPSLLPQAPVTRLDDSGRELSVWLWQPAEGPAREVALIRRVGREATVIDAAQADAEPIRVPVAELTQFKDVSFRWQNYTEPLERFAFWTYLSNTVFVTVTATLLTLILNAMTAFALSKYRFAGRNAIFVAILSTLMIPLSVVMVPSFLVIVGLGLSDNLWGVILSTAATPTGVFLLRQYMLTIPDDLIEAGRVDAASEFRIFWRIVLPLSAPALAVLAIFSVIWRWNDFLWPLIVLSSPENYTLQIGLNAFQGQYNVEWHYILAMTVVALLPVTLVFLVLQRYITEGVASSGVK